MTACEAYEPMVQAARIAVKENGFNHLVNVVSKRSDELTVGSGKPLSFQKDTSDVPCIALDLQQGIESLTYGRLVSDTACQ